MGRSFPTLLLIALAFGVAAAPAEARRHSAPKQDDQDQDASLKKDAGKKNAEKKDAAKPTQVGTFGDWGAYLAKSGKAKTCYALASPKERKPEVKREAAYVFIADRPGEKVHNEVSIIMGFPVKESGKAEARIGRASFDLVAKGSNAWIKNPEDESKFVEAMQHSGTLVVKAAAAKGPATADSYALDGFKQALARVSKDCK